MKVSLHGREGYPAVFYCSKTKKVMLMWSGIDCPKYVAKFEILCFYLTARLIANKCGFDESLFGIEARQRKPDG